MEGIISVRCINDRDAEASLRIGTHYYVIICEDHVVPEGEINLWYRIINEGTLNDVRVIGAHCHIRLASRFKIVPDELCSKYNQIKVLREIETELQRYGVAP